MWANTNLERWRGRTGDPRDEGGGKRGEEVDIFYSY
jgi:hypothetical protein